MSPSLSTSNHHLFSLSVLSLFQTVISFSQARYQSRVLALKRQYRWEKSGQKTPRKWRRARTRTWILRWLQKTPRQRPATAKNAGVGNGLVSARGRRGEREREREMRSNTPCMRYLLPIVEDRLRARESRADRELLAATGAIRNEFSAREPSRHGRLAFQDNRTDGWKHVTPAVVLAAFVCIFPFGALPFNTQMANLWRPSRISFYHLNVFRLSQCISMRCIILWYFWF